MAAFRFAFLALTALVASTPLFAQPKDNFGDLLPEGAKARVGTSRMHKTGGGAEWMGATLTPDGQFLLSPVADGVIEKIDVTTGRVVGTIGEKVPGRSGREILRLSSDGKRLMCLGDSSVAVRDADTGRLLTNAVTRVDWTRAGSLASAALSADGTTFAFGTNGEPKAGKKLTAIVWTVGEGKRRLEVAVEQDRFLSLALSPNGKIRRFSSGTPPMARNSAPSS